jgi:hypothetical protein
MRSPGCKETDTPVRISGVVVTERQVIDGQQGVADFPWLWKLK